MITPRVSLQGGVYDLLLTNGSLEMAEDGTAAACNVLTRVRLFRSECLINPLVDTAKNPNAGVDYYDIVFSAETSQARKELEIKTAILETPGIKSIIKWQWTQTARTANIVAVVQTDWGAETITATIDPL